MNIFTLVYAVTFFQTKDAQIFKLACLWLRLKMRKATMIKPNA